MKRIGMIVAVEMDAVIKHMGCEFIDSSTVAGYEIYRYRSGENEIIVLHCGAGEIGAASGTQFLITAYKVDFVVNFGVVGGLTEEMTTTKMCVVEKVVHYDYDTSAYDHCEVGRYLQYPDVYIPTTKKYVDVAKKVCPDLMTVICASGDKFVDAASAKKQLHEQFGADICEMEAAGIVLTCNRNGVDHLILKCVSDSVTGGAEEFGAFIQESAAICFRITMKILDEIL